MAARCSIWPCERPGDDGPPAQSSEMTALGLVRVISNGVSPLYR